MSISRLASQQVARSLGPIGAASAVAQPDADDPFDLLTKYIPTETLTLYVAAMSARTSIAEAFPRIGAMQLFCAGTVATPLLLLLASYGKQRASTVAAPFRPHWWPYVASAVAFLAWAPSVPGLIPESDKGLQVLAAFAALSISTLLALFEKAFAPRP